MCRRPPRSTLTYTPFPFTTLSRSDRGDPEHIADRAVRRRAAALAENLAAARLGDDRMDRQKIGRVIELADQFELMLELRADLAVDPFGIAQRRLFPSEPLEFRSEERRLGKACVSKCRSRWSPDT